MEKVFGEHLFEHGFAKIDHQRSNDSKVRDAVIRRGSDFAGAANFSFDGPRRSMPISE